jgi:hypothetical protein
MRIESGLEKTIELERCAVSTAHHRRTRLDVNGDHQARVSGTAVDSVQVLEDILIGAAFVIAKPSFEQVDEDGHELGFLTVTLFAKQPQTLEKSDVVTAMLVEAGILPLLHFAFFVIEVATHLVDDVVDHDGEIAPAAAGRVHLAQADDLLSQRRVLGGDPIRERGAFVPSLFVGHAAEILMERRAWRRGRHAVSFAESMGVLGRNATSAN